VPWRRLRRMWRCKRAGAPRRCASKSTGMNMTRDAGPCQERSWTPARPSAAPRRHTRRPRRPQCSPRPRTQRRAPRRRRRRPRCGRPPARTPARSTAAAASRARSRPVRRNAPAPPGSASARRPPAARPQPALACAAACCSVCRGDDQQMRSKCKLYDGQLRLHTLPLEGRCGLLHLNALHSVFGLQPGRAPAGWPAAPACPAKRASGFLQSAAMHGVFGLRRGRASCRVASCACMPCQKGSWVSAVYCAARRIRAPAGPRQLQGGQLRLQLLGSRARGGGRRGRRRRRVARAAQQRGAQPAVRRPAQPFHEHLTAQRHVSAMSCLAGHPALRLRAPALQPHRREAAPKARMRGQREKR